MTSSPSTPTVEAALESVGQALRTEHAAYLDALRTDGLDPLHEVLDRAARAHDDAQALLPTDESPSRHALWTAVRQYRREATASVWRPVRTRLGALDLGSLLRDRRQALRDARASLRDRVPETITRPEPDALYAPVATDGPLRRVGKAVVRAWRRGRALLGTSDVREQTVPMAALVTHHAETALPGAQAPALDAAEQTFVRWTADLERTATAWTHRLLELERILDRPAFHEVDAPSPVTPPPEDDPTSGVMVPDLAAVREEVRAQADALAECLTAGRALRLDAAEDEFRAAARTTVEELRRAAAETGTFMASRRSGPSWSSRSSPEDGEAARDRWPDWFDESVQRLSFLETLTALHDELGAQHRSLIDDVMEAGWAPFRSASHATAEGLSSLRDTIDTLLDAPTDAEAPGLATAFERHRDEGVSLLEERLLASLRERTLRRTTRAVIEAHRDAVASVVEEQPQGFVLHAPPEPGDDPVTPGASYTLEWRAGCRAVLDDVLFGAWQAAIEPLVARAEAGTERAAEVRAVVQFHLDTALQELREQKALPQEGGAEESYVENARTLADEGLSRAVDLLEEEGEHLRRAAGTVRQAAWEATIRAWTDLHDRTRAAGQAHAHVLRLQGRVVRGAHWLAVEAERRGRALATQLRRTLHRLQQQGRRLVRLGHAAVGTTPIDEAALRRTVETLSSVDTVLADLPLVYRRLFSFRPLRNEDLLVARDADRAVVERHAERWREGLTTPLVLTGPPGTGRTSLLNVLRSTTFASADYHHLELTERIRSEAAFAKRVARALELPHAPDATPTLDSLAERISALPDPDGVRVCAIEQFEHVFQRRVGGTALGSRILNFLSETDTRVLWIATTSNAGWQFVEASEPAAARLVERHTLDPFDRDELEELILARHRRSGLRLSFEAPEGTAQPILAHRLRSVDDEQRQALLRSAFFDHLHDVCGSNVMLALFYWFRSVSLDEADATLRVRPLDPVSFDVLDTLPLPHAFVLKALLEHGTLTVEELAEVRGDDPDTARVLLETLGNALLVAPADRVEGPGVFRFSSVDRETRYRIRPLLVHPVIRFLRSRNIVH